MSRARGGVPRSTRTATRPLKLTPVDPTEDELHKSVSRLLDIALLKPAFWTTFPSGMYALPKAAGGRLKAYGLKEGIPDVYTLYEGHTVWLELKRRGGVISRKQQEMHRVLEKAGSVVYVCRSPEGVVDALVREGVPLRLEIIKQLLGKPYEPAERQTTGDFYYGANNPSATVGAATERS